MHEIFKEKRSACGCSIDRCIPLEKARNMTPEQLILPVDTAVESFPQVRVSAAQTKKDFQTEDSSVSTALSFRRIPRVFFAVTDGEKTVGLGEVCAEKGLLNIKCLF